MTAESRSRDAAAAEWLRLNPPVAEAEGLRLHLSNRSPTGYRGVSMKGSRFRAELSLGSRKTLRLLRFVPKLAYGLGSGRLNATARAGASFSAPPDARGAGRSEAIDARFAASALCARREGTVRDGSRRAENASGGDSRRRLGKPPASRARGEETPGVAETRGSSGRARRAEPARGGREATAGRTTGGGT